MAHVLIIDDDEEICRFLSRWLEEMSHTTDVAHSLRNGFEKCNIENFDLVLLDLEFPEGNGIDILPDLLRTASQPEVIIITGASNVGGAELAFRYGAWDYVQKPVDFHEISLPITRALQYRKEKNNVRKPVVLKREKIIGNSPALNACLEAVSVVAAIDASVLVTGETGTGKELIARALHENSNRASKPFVPVDCGALPKNLVESCLFGHEKNAFTGAGDKRDGLIRQTNGGTLYLDEVGELPINIQTLLLRILQERCFRPLGADKEIFVDFRLIAATNRNLDEMVEKQLFRRDLMYRLRAIDVKVPPLRERGHDIEKIAVAKVNQLTRQYKLNPKVLSPEFLSIFNKYSWPGNVRELINVLKHAVAVSGTDTILHPIHLPAGFRAGFLNMKNKSAIGKEAGKILPWKEFRCKTEKEYLTQLLTSVGGNRKSAGKVSGISQSRLFELLKKHNFSRSCKKTR